MAGKLMPKKTKYRKVQRGTMAGRPKGRAAEVVFGEFGLQAVDPAWVTSQQIEAIRVTMTRKMKKVGRVFMRIFPDKAVSKKPAETRMGKGKGNVELWVSVVRRNAMVCEITGVDAATAKTVLHAAQYKLPMRTRLVARAAVPAAGVKGVEQE